jgi:hypothetical protein
LRDAPEAADRAALHDDLAEVRLASGDEDAALKELGAALALGSSRAAERLAARALSEGRIDRARALYRSLQEDAFRSPRGRARLRPRAPRRPRAVPGLAAPEAAGILARNPPQSPH